MRGRFVVVLASVFAIFLMHQGAVGVAAAAPMTMPMSTHAQHEPTAMSVAENVGAASAVEGCSFGHHCVFVRSAEAGPATAALIMIVAAAVAVEIIGICSRRLRFIAERPPPWTVPTQASLSVFRR